MVKKLVRSMQAFCQIQLQLVEQEEGRLKKQLSQCELQRVFLREMLEKLNFEVSDE